MATAKTPAKRTAKATPASAAPAATATTPPAAGKYWPAQKAWYAGIICQPDGTAWHLLLPKGVKFKAKSLAWGTTDKAIKDADSLYDGQANTAAMLAAGSPAAAHITTLIDGAYLPSRAEAMLLFATLKDKFETGAWYWTSTQQSASYAWYCYFGHGTQFTLHKSFEGSAVCVRRLVIQSFNPLGM